MLKPTRRGLTLIECLVSLVASSVVLGGLLGLYSVADQAARSNSSDVFATAMDYNLDRVLSEIGTTTSASANPTRRSFDQGGAFPHTAAAPNQFLVYERPRNIVATSYWTTAQGGPGPANPFPSAMASYIPHPFPLFINPQTGQTNNMTNIDLTKTPAGPPFSDNWLTGIVALHRRDPYDSNGDGVDDRFRTGILWQVELPMPRMSDYGLGGTAVGATFCPNGAGAGYAPAVAIPAIGALLARPNPHLLFAGARILGVGVQSFAIDARDPMTWQVTR